MRALAVRGLLAWQQGEPALALRSLDESVELAQAGVDGPALAMSLVGRAWARLAAGDVDGADADARAFESVALDPTARAAVGLVRAVRVHLLAARGRLAEASDVLAGVEAALREAGGPWGIAFALNMRAMLVQLSEGDAAAIPILRESIDLSRAIDDRVALLYGLVALAGGLVADEPAAAATLFGAAEVLAETTGLALSNPSSIALYERQTADLAARLGSEEFERRWIEGRASDLEALMDELVGHPPRGQV
jgi:hypothetical protein